MKNKYLARVMAGVGYLNVVMPSWLKKVDTDKLDLQLAHTCVIGELYGRYQAGIDKLGINDEVAEALGFYQSDDYGGEYKKLTKTWKQVIAKLRKAKR